MIWALRGIRNRALKKTFGLFNRYYKELTRSQWYTSERLKALQEEKLRHFVDYAYNNVLYYRDLFDRMGLRPGDIRTIEDLKYLPLLEKETIRKDPQKFVSSARNPLFLYRCYTSGSTGKPLTIFRDLKNVWFEHAILRRQWSWGGLAYSDPYATLKGEMLVPRHRENQPFWHYSLAEHKLLMSIYHISESTVEDYTRALDKYRPVAIEGYPSTVHVLARLMEAKNRRYQLKAVFTSSETLFDSQREVIESVFNAPIYDFFGSVERVAAIHTCEYGSYHIIPEYSIVEYLPVPDSAGTGVYQLVGTALNNEAMPLFRYRIGDMVWGINESCPCGREYPVIKRIEGREDDYIITPGGKWITRLDFIFKAVPDIMEGQIIQTKLDEIIIKIVPDRNYREETGRLLKKRLADRLRDNIDIQIKLVHSIPRHGRGKFRAIISYVDRQEREWDKSTC